MEQTWEEAAAALESWLATPLRDHLTSSNSQLSAVFEKLEKVTSNTVMTSQNLTTWWVAAEALST